MALPPTTFQILLESLERTQPLHRVVEEAVRSHQALLDDAIQRANPFAELISSVGRNLASSVIVGNQIAQSITNSGLNEIQIRNVISENSDILALTREIIQRQDWLLNPNIRSAAINNLATSAAINRSLVLSPNLFAASAALFEALDIEPSDTGVITVPESGSALVSTLEELLHVLEDAFEAVEIAIDRRALLRFIRWLFPLILTCYFAVVSSDQIEEGFDRIETTVEKSQSESREEHSVFENAINEALEQLNSLSKRLEGQLEEDNTAKIYIVVRAVPMTEERRFHGPQITWLIPGQEVEVVEHSKKWLRVIAHDPETNETHVGWVLKKYLRRVTDAPRPNSI